MTDDINKQSEKNYNILQFNIKITESRESFDVHI